MFPRTVGASRPRYQQPCKTLRSLLAQRSAGGGAEATRALVGLIDQRKVRCEGDRRDRYNRPLVHCWVGGLDLGREMVRLGWAVAAYGHEYDLDQADARAQKVGAWAGTFTLPKDWRRAQRAPVDPTWPPH
jgi:endonuclease YncB( thermonuclease family)